MHLMLICNGVLQVNETQGKIKEATRKMMALVSEVSMMQAQAMQLQQEVRFPSLYFLLLDIGLSCINNLNILIFLFNKLSYLQCNT